jgi:excisionase family DNA binding protein
MEQFMTLSEVGALTQLSRRTLSKYVKAGELHGYKVGATYRFAPSDVQAWLDHLKQSDPELIPHVEDVQAP